MKRSVLPEEVVILRNKDTPSPSKTLKAFQTALSSTRVDSPNSSVQ